MSEQAQKELKKKLEKADLTELDEKRLEEVAGGICDESCEAGCSACCSIGSGNRKPEI
jgi:hypothetical protein